MYPNATTSAGRLPLRLCWFEVDVPLPALPPLLLSPKIVLTLPFLLPAPPGGAAKKAPAVCVKASCSGLVEALERLCWWDIDFWRWWWLELPDICWLLAPLGRNGGARTPFEVWDSGAVNSSARTWRNIFVRVKRE